MIAQSEVDSLAARILSDAEAAGLHRVAIRPRLPRHLQRVAGLDFRVLDAVCRLGDGRVGVAGRDDVGVFFELRARPRGPLPPASAYHAMLAAYRGRGIVKSGEILLEPADARRMVDDVEGIGIAVLGVDCWHYADREKGRIVEEVGVGLDLSAVLDAPDVVTRSAEAARAFIASDLPAETELVSLVMDVPREWEVAASPE